MISQECLQALKDGKEIRHKQSGEIYSGSYLVISVDVLLNDDWEIVEKKVTLTESEFDKARAKVTTKFNDVEIVSMDKLKSELFK